MSSTKETNKADQAHNPTNGRARDRDANAKVIASIFTPPLSPGAPPAETRRQGSHQQGPKVVVATSEVATYREKFDEIKAMLRQNRSLALLYIDASKLSQIEHDYGSQIYEEVLQLVTKLILDMRGMQTRQDDLVTVNEKHGDIFLIFLSKKREEKPFGKGDLEHLADRIHSYLSKRIYRTTCSYLR